MRPAQKVEVKIVNRHNWLEILPNLFQKLLKQPVAFPFQSNIALAHFRLETRLSPETISNCSREMHKSI